MLSCDTFKFTGLSLCLLFSYRPNFLLYFADASVLPSHRTMIPHLPLDVLIKILSFLPASRAGSTMALLHWYISFNPAIFYEKLLWYPRFGKFSTKYDMSTATKARRLHGEKSHATIGENYIFKGVN